MRISDWSSDVCSSDLDELHALDAAGVRGHFLPLVDPRKLTPAPMLAVADGRGDDGGLQARERGLEQQIIAVSGGPPDRAQKLLRHEAEEERRGDAVILGRDGLSGGAEQHTDTPVRKRVV